MWGSKNVLKTLTAGGGPEEGVPRGPGETTISKIVS